MTNFATVLAIVFVLFVMFLVVRWVCRVIDAQDAKNDQSRRITADRLSSMERHFSMQAEEARMEANKAMTKAVSAFDAAIAKPATMNITVKTQRPKREVPPPLPRPDLKPSSKKARITHKGATA